MEVTDYINDALSLYSDTVYRLALANMGDKHDADDIFQDVFLKLASKPRIFQSPEHIKAWLIRVTLNRCKTVKNSARVRKIAPLDENIPYTQDETSDLTDYLRLLPEKYRAVIQLFYCEEMSVKEIGEALKAKESTVRTWLTRAREILREKLKGEIL